MKHALNFDWLFTPTYQEDYLNNFPKEHEVVNIPHSAKNIPYNYFDEKDYQFVSTYLKEFDVDEDFNDKVI